MTQVIDQTHAENWTVYHGDCCEVIKGIGDNSIHYTLFSPPFSSLFVYSDSERDMGNTASDDEFMIHFSFLVSELFRVTIQGRLVSVHCMNIPAMKERDGFIGIKDFRGDIIRLFQKHGFIYHSEVMIRKDPLIEATRTKALGLMHKQIQKDSSMCRQGLPDYICTFRKPGTNPEPISHPHGFTSYHGTDEPRQSGIQYSHNVWRHYADDVWLDIDQTKTLNYRMAREKEDERHICPLQLDTIARCIDLWSNKGDIVLSPFTGIGSEGYQAVLMGRRFVGIELKPSYYKFAVKHLEMASNKPKQLELFAS